MRFSGSTFSVLSVAKAAALASASSSAAHDSRLYDWGIYGAYPTTHYESFGAVSPWPLIALDTPECDHERLTFISPRGKSVSTPGPIILDHAGALVWMDTQWGQAMDFKVQSYNGSKYLTFWHGTDNGTFGEGYYLMLDTEYQVFRKMVPAGGFTGDLHEFRISADDTALMTMYEKRPGDLSAKEGEKNGWFIDSLFQEVDIVTGEMLFQWRASDHFPISTSLAPLAHFGTRNMAFDYFHINSVDKDVEGNYLVSSRYLCAVVKIDGTSGEVLWQLGGEHSSFEDLSGSAASAFTWQHHASWVAGNGTETTITVFNNGAYDSLRTAEHSSGLKIALDENAMTARLVQSYMPPDGLLVPSQGSVQALDGDLGNVLVGWGHTPSWTEFAADGQAVCDIHVGAVHLAWLGWCKNYRTFKHRWVGQPRTLPDVAMRPAQGALFVSWNGATEVDRWALQSAEHEEGPSKWTDHGSVLREGFETKITVPSAAFEFVRAVALDGKGAILGTSRPVSKKIDTVVQRMEAPQYGTPIDQVILASVGGSTGFLLALLVLWKVRNPLMVKIASLWAWRKSTKGHNYELLPVR